MGRLPLPGKRAGLNQVTVLLAALSLCMLSGCASSPEPSYQYTLSEPTPGLVRYRVFEGHDLVATLMDGSILALTVASVDEEAIHGKDGTTVPIADIRELRSPDEFGVGGAALAIGFYTLMVPVSILLLPVALPVLLFYDWEQVGQWPDQRLCRAVAHPEFYGYSAEGVIVEGEKTLPLQEVREEIARRELQCDPLALVAPSCAGSNNSGPGYEACVAERLPMEEAGFVAIAQWADGPLCRVHQHPEQFEFLASQPAEQREAVAEEARVAMESRKPDCSAGDVPDPLPPTN
jgi:hypothetical protein